MATGETRILVATAVVLAVCGVAATTVMLGTTIRRQPQRAAESRQLDNWMFLASEGNAVGDSNAGHTLLVFTDYQCPACRRLESVIEQLLGQRPTQVRVVYRHLPLRAIHSVAEPAALAVECAADQGSFASFHSTLFSNQDSLGTIPWGELARRAAIRDVDGFERCVSEQTRKGRIVADLAAATELGLRSTPSVVVDGLLLSTPPTLDMLTRTIDGALVAISPRRP